MPATRLQYGVSIRIDRPIDEVFAYLADPVNGMRHDPSIVSVRRTSEGPLATGATFRQVGRDTLGAERVYQLSILEHRPPTKLVFHGTGSTPGYERTTYVLEPVDGGTRLLVSHAGTDLGMKGPVAAMVKHVAKQHAHGALTRLKHYLESPERRP